MNFLPLSTDIINFIISNSASRMHISFPKFEQGASTFHIQFNFNDAKFKTNFVILDICFYSEN